MKESPTTIFFYVKELIFPKSTLSDLMTSSSESPKQPMVSILKEDPSQSNNQSFYSINQTVSPRNQYKNLTTVVSPSTGSRVIIKGEQTSLNEHQMQTIYRFPDVITPDKSTNVEQEQIRQVRKQSQSFEGKKFERYLDELNSNNTSPIVGANNVDILGKHVKSRLNIITTNKILENKPQDLVPQQLKLIVSQQGSRIKSDLENERSPIIRRINPNEISAFHAFQSIQTKSGNFSDRKWKLLDLVNQATNQMNVHTKELNSIENISQRTQSEAGILMDSRGIPIQLSPTTVPMYSLNQAQTIKVQVKQIITSGVTNTNPNLPNTGNTINLNSINSNRPRKISIHATRNNIIHNPKFHILLDQYIDPKMQQGSRTFGGKVFL